MRWYRLSLYSDFPHRYVFRYEPLATSSLMSGAAFNYCLDPEHIENTSVSPTSFLGVYHIHTDTVSIFLFPAAVEILLANDSSHRSLGL